MQCHGNQFITLFGQQVSTDLVSDNSNVHRVLAKCQTLCWVPEIPSLRRSCWGVCHDHQLPTEKVRWSTDWGSEPIKHQAELEPGGPYPWMSHSRESVGHRLVLSSAPGSAPGGICLEPILLEEGDNRGTGPLLFQNPQGLESGAITLGNPTSSAPNGDPNPSSIWPLTAKACSHQMTGLVSSQLPLSPWFQLAWLRGPWISYPSQVVLVGSRHCGEQGCSRRGLGWGKYCVSSPMREGQGEIFHYCFIAKECTIGLYWPALSHIKHKLISLRLPVSTC